MKCTECKGTLSAGRASHTVNRRGYHLILDDIPACVCEQCGQPLFSQESVRLIQEMVRSLDERKTELSRTPTA